MNHSSAKHVIVPTHQLLVVFLPWLTPKSSRKSVGTTRSTSITAPNTAFFHAATGAGGSSSHASMKAWRQRLQPSCDAVYMLDFPRPYHIETQAAAFVDALRRARKGGHRRVALVGVGMELQSPNGLVPP